MKLNKQVSINTSRFETIDGIRGIAALGVVIYHLSGNLSPDLNQLFPDFLNLIFSYGYLGVPIFFVVSGFVISLSIRESRITLKYAGTFVLRRSFRLDLTYWASIAFALVLLNIKNQVLDSAEPMPSFSNILAHMFYLQDLLAIKPVISVVYWTLCLEVQLYLFYIFTVWASQKVRPLFFCSEYLIHICLITIVGLVSLFLEFGLIEIKIPGLFVSNWHYFLLGILVSNVVRGLNYSKQILLAWLLIELFFQLEVQLKAYAVTGISSTLFIYFMWKKDLLNTFLTNGVFQYLGKISYTLYLVHPDIGWKFISFSKLVLQDYMTPLLAGIIFVFGIAISILVAHAFHLLFEKPSLWVVSKLKTDSVKTVYYNIKSKFISSIRDFTLLRGK